MNPKKMPFGAGTGEGKKLDCTGSNKTTKTTNSLFLKGFIFKLINIKPHETLFLAIDDEVDLQVKT